MKRINTLIENKLKRIISKSVKNILSEVYTYEPNVIHRFMNRPVNNILKENKTNNYEIWYRGYDSNYGLERNHLLWLTNDISYARAYGNRVEEYTIDTTKLDVASIYEIDEILGYEFDYVEGPDKEEMQILLSEGFNSYEFSINKDLSDCICLWSKAPIVKHRTLTKAEFDEIEKYEGFDNKEY